MRGQALEARRILYEHKWGVREYDELLPAQYGVSRELLQTAVNVFLPLAEVRALAQVPRPPRPPSKHSYARARATTGAAAEDGG